MPENRTAPSAEKLRIRYGFWVVIWGLTLVLVVFLTASAKWHAASDVTAVVGSVSGIIGTIVGAFFGFQVGSTGKEKAEADRAKAESKSLSLAAALQPEVAARILGEGKD